MEVYKKEQINNKVEAIREQESSLSSFIKQTYQLFAGSLAVGATGAYVGMSIPAISQYYWAFLILEFLLIFSIGFARNKPGLNFFLLMFFALVSGLTMSVMIGSYINAGAGGIVTQALVLTTVAFGGLSTFAMNTTKDFTSIGKYLFIALITVVVGGLLNVFWLHLGWLATGISVISAFLFSAFILYDTQNIIRGNYSSPIDGALSLYLDFINLFTSLLNLLGIFRSND